MLQEINLLFDLIILIVSVVIHEVSHGFVAYLFGDTTAKDLGRLSLNPLRHLDLYGSLIIPLVSFLLGGFIIGWAKPVPYDPSRLRDPKRATVFLSLAGPLSNILLAVFFGLLIRHGAYLSFLPIAFFQIATLITVINLSLAVFNLVPIPPLDGSKILFSLLPDRWRGIEFFIERSAFILIIIFIFFLYQFFVPVISGLFRIITGLSL
jgi:Zn-dependent protease